jgi:hypothetical protein
MKARNLSLLFVAFTLAIGLITSGCSGKNKLLKEVSGQWQNSQNSTLVDIHLVGDDKSMTVDGQPYTVSVDKVEMINYLVRLKAQNGSGEPQEWTLKELWDENGAHYKLAFSHNGFSEVLVPKAQS